MMKDNGYVYLIIADELPYVKIGYASELRTRLNELQVASPTELRFLGWLKGAGTNVETALHKLCSEHRFRGEWFYLNIELIRIVCEYSRKAGLSFFLDLSGTGIEFVLSPAENPGGEGQLRRGRPSGYRLSDASRLMIALNRLGSKHSNETRAKISDGLEKYYENEKKVIKSEKNEDFYSGRKTSSI
jgi:hypothetical protein